MYPSLHSAPDSIAFPGPPSAGRSFNAIAGASIELEGQTKDRFRSGKRLILFSVALIASAEPLQMHAPRALAVKVLEVTIAALEPSLWPLRPLLSAGGGQRRPVDAIASEQQQPGSAIARRLNERE